MATIRSTYNDFRAGALVLVSIIAALVIVVILSGGLEFLGKRSYLVHFPLEVGVGGLQVGSEVRLGGRRIGSVTGIRFGPEGAALFEHVEVDISVDQVIDLRGGAIAFLESPLIGSQSNINFTTEGAGELFATGDPIPGLAAPPGFLSQMGYGQEQAGQVRNILGNFENFSAKLDGSMDEVQNQIIPDVRKITADASTRSEDWFDRIDSITRKLDEFGTGASAAVESVELRLDQVEELLATAQAYLDENRADVRTSVRNFREGSESFDSVLDRIENEVLDLVEGFLEDGRAGIADARAAIERVNGLVAEGRADLLKSMANFRLASDTLRDSMEEIRRAPWRLLYRPDTGEMEFELLYDSARIYAGAVSDLRAAAESLNTTVEAGGRAALKGENLQPLLDDLYRSFDTYQRAEENFLDLIIEKK